MVTQRCAEKSYPERFSAQTLRLGGEISLLIYAHSSNNSALPQGAFQLRHESVRHRTVFARTECHARKSGGASLQIPGSR